MLGHTLQVIAGAAASGPVGWALFLSATEGSAFSIDLKQDSYGNSYVLYNVSVAFYVVAVDPDGAVLWSKKYSQVDGTNLALMSVYNPSIAVDDSNGLLHILVRAKPSASANISAVHIALSLSTGSESATPDWALALTANDTALYYGTIAANTSGAYAIWPSAYANAQYGYPNLYSGGSNVYGVRIDHGTGYRDRPTAMWLDSSQNVHCINWVQTSSLATPQYMQLSATGTITYQKTFSTTSLSGAQWLTGADIDSSFSNVWVSGYWDATYDVGVAYRMDTTGTVQWMRKFGPGSSSRQERCVGIVGNSSDSSCWVWSQQYTTGTSGYMVKVSADGSTLSGGLSIDPAPTSVKGTIDSSGNMTYACSTNGVLVVKVPAATGIPAGSYTVGSKSFTVGYYTPTSSTVTFSNGTGSSTRAVDALDATGSVSSTTVSSTPPTNTLVVI